ncbi:MAG: nucleotidyl transferase AbiEii/AbiGii toxin family protein [Acidobacteriota bacterium]|jgi:predicted nucleotidyltransferase component of viral defense system
MAFRDIYERQVRLLLRVIPLVAQETCFALKGGTAINLFVRNMPRLSVDIDLTYLPVAPRHESLTDINAAMLRIAARISKVLTGAQITKSELTPEKAIVKLIVRHEQVQIKIEVTPVLRGCVFQPERRAVSPAVEEAYGFAEMQVVSFPDLYAGKLVAALDRQHPRDLFDVRDLLSNEGIDEDLRRAFAVYLVSHNRPMAEVLNPVRKPLDEEFLRGFEGMTDVPITLTELEDTREAMIVALVGEMPEAHRHFLISFERGEPNWQLLVIPGAEHLPAVIWRQKNLATLTSDVRSRLVENLEAVLNAPKKQLSA